MNAFFLSISAISWLVTSSHDLRDGLRLERLIYAVYISVELTPIQIAPQNALTDVQRVKVPSVSDYWKPLADDVSVICFDVLHELDGKSLMWLKFF